jgi:uncharacterized protein (DUF433 family)
MMVLGGTPAMKKLKRITMDPEVMGGKPCIRGLRVTVGTIVGLLAAGRTYAQILKAYPYVEEEDIREALAYAAWRSEEFELPLKRR